VATLRLRIKTLETKNRDLTELLERAYDVRFDHPHLIEHGFFTVAVALRPSLRRRARLLKECCPYRALPLLRFVRRGFARTGLLLPRSSPWQNQE
jgi:hypothetical protein